MLAVLLFFWCFLLLLPWLPPWAPPSAFRAERDRAASWKVARAGVDGLLALPLFVVTVGMPNGTDSLLRRSRSVNGTSFFSSVGAGAVLSTRSASFFGASVLTGTLISFTGFMSLLERALLFGGGTSGILAGLPFGTAAGGGGGGGLALLLSALDWIEFPRARDETGRDVLLGAGDARAGTLGSGREASTGEEAAEIETPGALVLLQAFQLVLRPNVV